MSDKIEKKVKKRLKKYIDECIKNYIEAHLFELKSKIINIEGLVSKEEYEKLQFENTALSGQVSAWRTQKINVEQENKNLNSSLAVLQRERDDLQELLQAATQKNSELEKKEKVLAREAEMCKQEKKKALEEVEKRNEDMETAKKISDELARYKRDYGKIQAAYDTYRQLDKGIRSELTGLFGEGRDPVLFFCCALQSDHLDNFWDYLCSKINNRQLAPEDTARLTCIFDFCFDMVNASQQEPMYVRLQPRTGISFDNRSMRKTSDSSQLGIVQKVELPGYAYAVSGKIARYSLVIVARGE